MYLRVDFNFIQFLELVIKALPFHTEAATRSGLFQKVFLTILQTHRKTLVLEFLTGLRPSTLLKKGLWYSFYPVNYGKFSSD